MKFTTQPSKDYSQDIRVIYEALYNEEVFSFSKYCDGEWAVLENRGVDNSEFCSTQIMSKIYPRESSS